MPDITLNASYRRWNAQAGEWETVTVQTTCIPRRKHARKAPRRNTPRDLTGLSGGSPLPAWWRDTAYAPGSGFADMRTFIKPETTRTHHKTASIYRGQPSNR